LTPQRHRQSWVPLVPPLFSCDCGTWWGCVSHCPLTSSTGRRVLPRLTPQVCTRKQVTWLCAHSAAC
jgi:hypothetical protein